MSHGSIQFKVETEFMDKYFLSRFGELQAVPYKFLKETIGDAERMQWATKHAIYQYLTLEMLTWLDVEMGSMKAIEIGAGNGAIGRWLGIPRTDSKLQERDDIKMWYQLMKQPTITYPSDVLKYEALDAIDHFKPDCVIGAFITQYGATEKVKNSNPYGPNETEILKRVKKYIHFGNKVTHADKLIFKQPHRELYFPWLVTRCPDQSLNRVWIWDMK